MGASNECDLNGNKINLFEPLNKEPIDSSHSELLLPLLAKREFEFRRELFRHTIWLSIFVKCDRLPNVVHYHLARITALQMSRKLLANLRELFAIHIIVQSLQ
jgi:hypothetical protein